MSAPESWYATRTLRALEILVERPGSAADVAEQLQVHPRTARRLLNRLIADGYVTSTGPDGRIYAPTMRIVALAGGVLERAEVTQIGLPYVRELREQTHDAAQLCVPTGRSVLCLVHPNGSDPTLGRPHLRELLPSHCTAPGKALLAYRHDWRDHVLARRLDRHTGRTHVDPRDLLYDLERVRRRGFAVEDGEYEVDRRGIAAPIRDHKGETIAALGITASTVDLPAERLPHVARVVMGIAAAASNAHGFTSGVSLRTEDGLVVHA